MTARLTPTGYASLMVLVPLPATAPTIHAPPYLYIRGGEMGAEGGGGGGGVGRGWGWRDVVVVVVEDGDG
ncbi:hypothetical protein HZH68_006805 [Vespula germanica]|uniref:Uncharacterized protein n=1 Tax=Vespula germanica TaxID=30212 RepID=A0A834KHA6_VESGE|nr:hypothetical protein HZH68_006805 [Vespula germanica]